MEETKTMTAERSLEIIGEVMEQNRSRVTEFLRRWMLVAGLTTIGVAVLVGIIGVWLRIPLSLWLLIPLIMYLVMKRVEGSAPQNSLGVVGMWVKDVWISFMLMVFVLGFLSSVSNFLLIRLCCGNVCDVAPVLMDDIKALWPLLGMAVSITGFLLRKKLLVACGLLVGVLGFFFWHFGVLGRLYIHLMPVDPTFMGTVWSPLQEPFAFVIFALVGMILPALLLKSESK